jgi:MoxR-like ATPase
MDPKDSYQAVLKEVKKRIAGKEEVIELIFIAIVSNGHVLLEGVPGIAKTTMVRTLAEVIQAEFGRVQGTSDLEYKDIVGYTYMDESHVIKLKKGPIFTNLLLIDELNRAPPKVASALLESLEERQVTFSDRTIPLLIPFLAIATQNPLSIEGTMPIPKVLADRFLMRIGVDYPSEEEEREMLRIKESEATVTINKVLDTKQIIEMQGMVDGIKLNDNIINYLTDIVNATRKDIHIVMGASPRAEIAFMRAGKARALIYGRSEVTTEDIKFLAKPILSHRLAVRSTGGIGVNGIIDGIIASVKPGIP